MSELKPCPFCGGEARPYKSVVVLPLPIGKLTVFDGIKCMGCGAAVGMTFGDRHGTTEAEAATTWNTRHVETCHDKNGFDESLGFECTVCRTMVDSYMQTTCSDKREQFHYCPNCGRKVE